MKIALLSRWLREEHERSGTEGGTVEQLATAVQNLGHEVVALSQSPDVTDDMSVASIRSTRSWRRSCRRSHPGSGSMQPLHGPGSARQSPAARPSLLPCPIAHVPPGASAKVGQFSWDFFERGIRPRSIL